MDNSTITNANKTSHSDNNRNINQNHSPPENDTLINQTSGPATDVNTNDTAKHQNIDLTSKQTNVSLNLDTDKAASTNETANFSSISVSTFSNGSSVLNSGDAKENTKFAASEIASQSVSSEAAVPSSDGVKVIGSSDGPIDAGEQGATDKSSKVQADHNVITGSISTTAKDATVVTSYQNSTTEEISGKHERNASNVTKTIETSTEPDIEHNTESIRTIAKERATNLGSNSSTVKPPSSRSSNADDLAAKNERSHVKSSASKSSSSSRKRSDRADAGGNKSVKQAPVGNSQAKQAPVGNSPAENSARAAEFSGNMSEHRK
ncbi:hypothetical protein JYU34_008171 [Plutella xylostella]|uniref:Uncharacterized protein n=1 Tax=Plutella xylostella TaxID=51655 RepID=A0ABQ7QNX7_PLUXY|nr:hypothetical protein JYU34_008171 [Plutella xylostella]